MVSLSWQELLLKISDQGDEWPHLLLREQKTSHMLSLENMWPAYAVFCFWIVIRICLLYSRFAESVWMNSEDTLSCSSELILSSKLLCKQVYLGIPVVFGWHQKMVSLHQGIKAVSEVQGYSLRLVFICGPTTGFWGLFKSIFSWSYQMLIILWIKENNCPQISVLALGVYVSISTGTK